MIDLTVYDFEGNDAGRLSFDDSLLGEFVNRPLVHAAVVMFEANQRQGTAKTKGIREVVGVGCKPFKQKGTGRARMGHRRRFGSRGGGTCFGPTPRDYSLSMPKAQRRAAMRSALLGRLRAGDVSVVRGFSLDAPKTAKVAKFLQAVSADRGVLLVVEENNEILWKSARNLPKADMQVYTDLSAYSVLRRPRVIFTEAALQALPAFIGKDKKGEGKGGDES